MILYDTQNASKLRKIFVFFVFLKMETNLIDP